MPHIHLDHSSNLRDRIDIPGLCLALRDAAAETGLFPVAGIRVRAVAADHCLIADGNPDHAYLDISVRLRGGRPLEARRSAAQHIFGAAEAYCAELLARSSLMLSLEMRDIDPDLSPKVSSIRRYLPENLQ